ncbi:phospholipase A2 inhibitor gamma subunit B-like [Discoglossus pictus]
MGPLLAITFVLSAFTATGYSLSCIQCMTTDGSSCIGASIGCSSTENVCVSSITRTTVGVEEPLTVFSRTCGKSEWCGKVTSISHPGGYIKNNHTCCYMDDCTPPIPTIPTESTKKNGKICRGCFSATSDSCADIAMECTGNEIQCIKVITTTSGIFSTKSILSGCASNATCEIGDQYSISEHVQVKAEVSCS